MREVEPFSFTIVQKWSGSPVAVFVTARRTPSAIGETTTVRPRASEQAIVRTPLAVASETDALERARSSKSCGVTETGPSDRNQRKPEYCPARGWPRERRNRTEPSESPSTSPPSQPQEASDEIASTEPTEYRSWSAVPVQTVVPPRPTVAVAVSRPSEPVTTTFVSKYGTYSSGTPRSSFGVQSQTKPPVASL